MKIREYLKGESLTLALEGNFDETSSAEVEERLEQILPRDIKTIYFDLCKVQHISSAGIRVLIIAYKKAVKHGKKVLIEDMSDKVRGILSMVGILSLFAP